MEDGKNEKSEVEREEEDMMLRRRHGKGSGRRWEENQ